VPRDRIELPTRGFSVELCKIPDCQHFQHLDSLENFDGIFGFVWFYLKIFDLDGHNLGTIGTWEFSTSGPFGFLKK